MTPTNIQIFYALLGIWAVVGGLAWYFESGKAILLRAKNPFQFIYRALWFGPLVTAVALAFVLDGILGKITLFAETEEQRKLDEEEANKVKPPE